MNNENVQLGFFNSAEIEQEDITAVMKELSVTCNGCRLSMLHPNNRGVIYRGNPYAKIAMVGAAPRDSETERGVAMIGNPGREVEKWLKYIRLDSRTQVFFTYTTMCQPPRTFKEGRMTQRDPEFDEVSNCFGPRCLRVLRAMPNLEICMILGYPAAKSFLAPYANPQDSPKSKTHEGQYFETSYLPGVAMFCLPDPVNIIRDPSPEKTESVVRLLDFFRVEYLETGKVTELARRAREAREEKGLGLL